MKNTSLTAALGLSLALAGCAGNVDTATVTETRPNILLIIGDDMGFSDLGVYGSEAAIGRGRARQGNDESEEEQKSDVTVH